MKKYIYIFKTELMSNLQYIFDILVGFIGYCILIFIFLNLWQYLYSDPNELINGYNMTQMIWYVIVTEILWTSLGGRKLCRKICEDVKSGNIAYNINKPYNYVEYSLFTHLGITVLKMAIVTILGILIGMMYLHVFPNHNVLTILGVVISASLATIINIYLITTISLVSFFIEDANPFYWLYSKLILVVGTLFPVEFFPQIIQPILKYSPIYAVSYGPAKLFVDFNINNFINIIFIQILYLFISYLICHFIYNKGVRKLNVNGG